MGAVESKDKMYCTRYLNGDGPPPLEEQVERGINGASLLRRDTIVEGNQPDGGQIAISVLRRSLAGYPKSDTIQMSFVFEDGIQTEKHPNPGQKYLGLRTVAFLPLNDDGGEISKLLEIAFQYKLLFTVAANFSGNDQVTYTDIPLKSNDSGDSESSGYPDPTYLKTVRKILKSKGIKREGQFRKSSA